MRRFLFICFALFSFSFSNMAFAAKAPLFFNTGDELFEVKNSPDLGEGYKLGYKCQHFGLFFADAWTWGCEMAAVNKADSSYSPLPSDMSQQYASKYSLGDRDRGFWNHFGILLMLLGIAAYVVFNKQSSKVAS